MADANTHQSNNYPYNIIPQFRSPAPSGTISTLECPEDFSKQFIIIDANNLVVVKGWDWKAKFDISQFFIPNELYQVLEFDLKYDSDYKKYTTINYPTPDNTIEFICIFPMYIESMSLDDQNDWKLNWKFSDDPTFIDPIMAEDDNNWNKLGRIFMLSTTKDKPLKPIQLQNRTGEDIKIKILIGN